MTSIKAEQGSNAAGMSHVQKFVSPGILLFIDQLVVAVSGWAFWLVISKLTTTSEVGSATAIYSLVLLITTVTQLGLEYPLLKKSHAQRTSILGTVMTVELMITAAAIPIMLLAVNGLYQESIKDFAWIALGILVFSSVFFVSRFALLGISDAKSVLAFDILGTAVKFIVGFALVFAGYGTGGILVAFLLHAVTITIGTMLVARKSFGFDLRRVKLAREIIRDGLVNMPSKLSRMFILSLSVVLLAAYGTSSAETGIFYIAVMISIAAGGFASSIAFMAIPASSAAKTDLSSGSMRLGLGLTAPIIAALLSSPGGILSVFGTEYAAAKDVLFVLSIGILPSVIAANAISKFNNLGQPRRLILIGSIQLISFFVSFYTLVPPYGILGAAYAMTIAFVCAAIPSIILSEGRIWKYTAASVASVSAGCIAGILVGVVGKMHPAIAIAISIAVSLLLVFKLKTVTLNEVAHIVQLSRRGIGSEIKGH